MSETSPTPFPVTHDVLAHRFEATAPDGEVAGYLTYDLVEARSAAGKGSMVTTHTIVQPAFEGRGVGSTLARAALDHARAEHLVVIPECSFVWRYVERHAEYQDLLP